MVSSTDNVIIAVIDCKMIMKKMNININKNEQILPKIFVLFFSKKCIIEKIANISISEYRICEMPQLSSSTSGEKLYFNKTKELWVIFANDIMINATNIASISFFPKFNELSNKKGIAKSGSFIFKS
jgi:hypothetical protein